MVKVPELIQGLLDYHRASKPGEAPPKHKIDRGTGLFDIAAAYIGLDPQDSKNWKAIWQAVAAFVRANSTEEAKADKTNGFVDENHITAGKSLIIPEEVLGQAVADNTLQETPEPASFERPRQSRPKQLAEAENMRLSNSDAFRTVTPSYAQPLRSGRSVDEVSADKLDPDPVLEHDPFAGDPTIVADHMPDKITNVDPKVLVADKAEEIGDPTAVAAREEFVKENPDAAADLGIEIADEVEPPKVTREQWFAALHSEEGLPEEWLDLDLSWQNVPVVGRDPSAHEDPTFNKAYASLNKSIQRSNDEINNAPNRNPINPYGEGTYFNPIEKPAPEETLPRVAKKASEE